MTTITRKWHPRQSDREMVELIISPVAAAFLLEDTAAAATGEANFHHHASLPFLEVATDPFWHP